MSKTISIARWSLVGLAVALIASLAGVAISSQVSADGGGSGSIHACLTNGVGQARIVGADEDCKKNET